MFYNAEKVYVDCDQGFTGLTYKPVYTGRKLSEELSQIMENFIHKTLDLGGYQIHDCNT